MIVGKKFLLSEQSSKQKIENLKFNVSALEDHIKRQQKKLKREQELLNNLAFIVLDLRTDLNEVIESVEWGERNG